MLTFFYACQHSFSIDSKSEYTYTFKHQRYKHYPCQSAKIVSDDREIKPTNKRAQCSSFSPLLTALCAATMHDTMISLYRFQQTEHKPLLKPEAQQQPGHKPVAPHTLPALEGGNYEGSIIRQ